jgi:hypothetical protein
MLNQVKASPFKNKVVIALAGILICLIPVIAISFLLRDTDPSAAENSTDTFEYCGTTPSELCVLSFGRDGAGNAIINFFVPNKNFPEFYLVVKKAGMESRYECQKSTEIKSSVFCIGEPLSLQQTIEVRMLAEDDQHTLTTGNFFVEALLVSAQSPQGGTPESEASLETFSLEQAPPVEQGDPFATNSVTGKISPTITASPTSSSSYPYP